MGDFPSSLIGSKLRAAELAYNNVPRPIVENLCVGSLQTSVCIVGVAGAGKSTLMRQLNARLQLQGAICAWLNLDARDDIPATFLTYLFEAMKQFFEGSDTGVAKPSDFGTPLLVENAFIALQNLVERLPSNCILFLDDMHHIKHPQLISGLGYFLDSCVGHLHVVVGSRTLPELQIQRREIEGSFRRISQDELRFTPFETAAFFGAVSEIELTKEETQSIHASTEGWVAGLQFAAIALRNAPAKKRKLIAELSGAQTDLARYLAKNAFEIQPREVQEFLLHTAPLTSFNAELCQYVCPQLNAADLLGKIRENNLFLISLDVSGEWFRYHHLFGDFLLSELDKTKSASARDIGRKASAWYAAKEMPEAAIRYCLDTKEYADAAKLIAKVGLKATRDEGQVSTVLRWIETLPTAYRSHYPQILVAHSTALVFTRGGAEARRLLTTMYEGLSQDPPRWILPNAQLDELLCYAQALELVSYSADEDCAKALDGVAEWLVKWPYASDTNLAATMNVKAHSLMIQNNFVSARNAATQAQASALRSGSSYVSIWAECIEVMILCAEGNFTAASTGAARVRNRADRELGDHTQLKLMADLICAFVHYEQGDRSTAYDLLGDGEEFANRYGPVEPLLIMFCLRAQMLREKGNLRGAFDALERGFDIGLATGLTRLSVTMLADRVTFHLEAGDLTAAQTLCDKWGLLDPKSTLLLTEGCVIQPTIRKRIAIEMAIARNAPSRAVMLCQSLLRDLQISGRFRAVIRIGILRAVALVMDGQTKKGWRDMSATLRRAKDAGFVASFFELRHLCMPVIRDIVAYRNTLPNIEQSTFETPESWILRVLDTGPATSDGEGDMAVRNVGNPQVRLTEREVEMLRLVVLGQSNAQIAGTLLISTSTVKWHLHNAFQKLDAKNRSSAVAKARDLGLL